MSDLVVVVGQDRTQRACRGRAGRGRGGGNTFVEIEYVSMCAACIPKSAGFYLLLKKRCLPRQKSGVERLEANAGPLLP